MHRTAPHAKAGCALRCSVPQTQQVVWRWTGCRKKTVHRLRSNLQLVKTWQQKKSPDHPFHVMLFSKRMFGLVAFFSTFKDILVLKMEPEQQDLLLHQKSPP